LLCHPLPRSTIHRIRHLRHLRHMTPTAHTAPRPALQQAHRVRMCTIRTTLHHLARLANLAILCGTRAMCMTLRQHPAQVAKIWCTIHRLLLSQVSASMSIRSTSITHHMTLIQSSHLRRYLPYRLHDH
ncbi:MAG: hypothetical protein JWQ11_4916, partial [Rhizobacter sp.]|nr:hypothetical protein [Rhizobacter sp.]